MTFFYKLLCNPEFDESVGERLVIAKRYLLASRLLQGQQHRVEIKKLRYLSSVLPVLTGVLLLAAPSFAQDPSPSPAETPATDGDVQSAETERVIVTGSHIPTAAEVGPNPVQIIDRETIDRSGERTGEDLLRNLPIANTNQRIPEPYRDSRARSGWHFGPGRIRD